MRAIDQAVKNRIPPFKYGGDHENKYSSREEIIFDVASSVKMGLCQRMYILQFPGHNESRRKSADMARRYFLVRVGRWFTWRRNCSLCIKYRWRNVPRERDFPLIYLLCKLRERFGSLEFYNRHLCCSVPGRKLRNAAGLL
jgi:hypothetical protein